MLWNTQSGSKPNQDASSGFVLERKKGATCKTCNDNKPSIPANELNQCGQILFRIPVYFRMRNLPARRVLALYLCMVQRSITALNWWSPCENTVIPADVSQPPAIFASYWDGSKQRRLWQSFCGLIFRPIIMPKRKSWARGRRRGKGRKTRANLFTIRAQWKSHYLAPQLKKSMLRRR